MHISLGRIIDESYMIALDYLEATGELGDRAVARDHILTTIRSLVLRGEHRSLLLSNKAIDAYRTFKAEDDERVSR
jgi:hypothetical protein